MDEFELIRQYFTRTLTDSDVRIGIGDDGALLRPAAGRDLITVVDTLVEGVHYPLNMAAADIAWRAVAVNLSDIAAMGARPRWMTLALTLREADPNWLAEFSDGLFAAAAEHDVSLVGGDTTRGRQVVVSIQITGDVDPDRVLTRSGAKAGDRIYISGTAGDAAAGLELLRSGTVSSDTANELVDRFRRPNARIALAQAIAPLASAAIDLSDGLYADTLKLLQASGAGGRIAVDALPMSAALRAEFDAQRARQFALAGGDDYELCFTLPAEEEYRLSEIALQQNVRLTRVGIVTEGVGLDCTDNGAPFAYLDAGYRHFDAAEKAWV